jgi:hypothetical protein
MQATAAATDARPSRGYGGELPHTADPTRDAFNLAWRPRAGNVSGDTRAGISGR